MGRANAEERGPVPRRAGVEPDASSAGARMNKLDVLHFGLTFLLGIVVGQALA